MSNAKPKPRWGNRPRGLTRSDHRAVPANLLQQLSTACGLDSTRDHLRIEELRDDLQDIVDAQMFAAYVDETEVAAPDRRAALIVLDRLAGELATKIAECDLSTRRDLFSDYRNWRLDHEVAEPVDSYELFRRDVRALGRLRESLADALTRARNETGGRKPAKGVEAARDLMFLFESYSGKRLTFTPSNSGFNPKSFIRGHGIKEFVLPALKFSVPGVSGVGLETTLRRAYALHKRSRRPRANTKPLLPLR